MNKHVITKSRAVGISHYRVEEILPVSVLARYPSTVEHIHSSREATPREMELQILVKELEELLFAEYDGMPNTPDRREALGSSVEEHLYSRLKGTRRD